MNINYFAACHKIYEECENTILNSVIARVFMVICTRQTPSCSMQRTQPSLSDLFFSAIALYSTENLAIQKWCKCLLHKDEFYPRHRKMVCSNYLNHDFQKLWDITRDSSLEVSHFSSICSTWWWYNKAHKAKENSNCKKASASFNVLSFPNLSTPTPLLLHFNICLCLYSKAFWKVRLCLFV